MKKHIYAIFLICIASINIDAQVCDNPPNCILNPLLNASQGGDLTSAIMSDWYRSHGSPNVSLGTGYNGANQINMWSSGSQGKGEGIFACFNFKKNHKYKICMWAKNNSSNQSGFFNIKATTGLSQGSLLYYSVPTPATSELVTAINSYSQNWTLIQVNYTPSDNFSQLWIFPFSTNSDVPDYSVVVSKVEVIETINPYSLTVGCEGNIVLEAPNPSCTNSEWYSPTGELLGIGDVTIENATPEMSGTYTLYHRGVFCDNSVQVEVIVGNCNCEEHVQLDFEAGNISLDPNIYYPGIFSEISSGQGTTVGWYWDFGDGNTSTEQNPQYTYPYSNATYTVCLTIIRKIGGQTCCKKVCKEVIVNVGAGEEGELIVPETPSVGFQENQLEAFPNAIHFTNITNTANIFREYYWDFGDGTSSRNPNPNHIYTKEGTYEVCLKVKDTNYNDRKDMLKKKTSRYCHQIEIRSEAK
jgi:hypothetical protein